jgi:hypothetical protein
MTPSPQLPAPSRLIETEIGNPPADPTPVSRQSLPEDLLQQASRRLGIMCLVIAGLWIANLVLAHLLQPPPTKMPDTAILRLFDMMG